MLASQVTAREIRQRLMNPPNGRVSSERDVVSAAEARRRKIAHEAELTRRLKHEAQIRAIETAIAIEEERRLTAASVATPEGEVIPVIPRFGDIVGQVCKFFDVTHIDLISSRRTKDVVRPRQIVMFIARHFTALSLPQIAARLGGRDHTTAMHGHQKIAELIADGDMGICAAVDHIKWELGIR
jgi:chromosomal replication initiation ATPase DnaA